MISRARDRALLAIALTSCALLGGSCLFPQLSDLTTCAHGCAGGSASSTASASSVGGATSTSSTSSTSMATSTSSTSGAGGLSCALRPDQHGPEGVLVQPSGGFPPFCIDSTEVSVAQYKEFFTGNNFPVAPALVPPQCAWKTVDTNASFTPEGTGNNPYIWNYYKTGIEPDRPIQGLDWCDAAIYCQWAGKRLCGADKQGGGHVDTSKNPQWAQGTEWFRACEGPQGFAFGYGPAGVQGNCNLDHGTDAGDPDPFKTTDVTEPAACVTTWPSGQVHDMIGNVMEYEDNCDEASGGGATDRCYLRGGPYPFAYDYTSCEFIQGTMMAKRGDKGEYLGARCCW